MANFYAYKKDSDTSIGDLMYRELQLHQFPSKGDRDAWVSAYQNASSVKFSEIPANHLRAFMEFSKSRQVDSGFWGVVDSGTN